MNRIRLVIASATLMIAGTASAQQPPAKTAKPAAAPAMAAPAMAAPAGKSSMAPAAKMADTTKKMAAKPDSSKKKGRKVKKG